MTPSIDPDSLAERKWSGSVVVSPACPISTISFSAIDEWNTTVAMNWSIIEYCGLSENSSCGYCKSSRRRSALGTENGVDEDTDQGHSASFGTWHVTCARLAAKSLFATPESIRWHC